MRRHPLGVLLAAGLFLACELAGQHLVADLAQTPLIVPSSQPSGFLDMGTWAFFAASTLEGGFEPFVTDGTPSGTHRLRDIVVGAGSSWPRALCAHQGQVLFLLSDASQYVARFALTDGTAAGTVLLPDILGGQYVSGAVSLPNGVLLGALGPVYTSDLTVAGTQPIPGMSGLVSTFTAYGATYAVCAPAVGQYEIWATDGSAAGSQLVVPAVPGYAPPQNFTSWNGRIYYQEFDGGCWLSSTDGIAGRTRHAMLHPGPIPEHTSRMFARNGDLVCTVEGGIVSTDATPAGTQVLPLALTFADNLCEYAGTLFLSASDAAHGNELWTTDGTVAGTSLVADFVPGPGDSWPFHFVETPAGIHFRALDAQSVPHLRRITGPGAVQDCGAMPVDAPYNMPTNPMGAPTTGFVPFGNGVLFSAEDSLHGVELWFGSGAQPPALVADIDHAAPGLDLGPEPVTIALRDQFLFGLSGGAPLRATDGTAVQVVAPWAGTPYGAKAARFGDRFAYLGTATVRLADPNGANAITLFSGAFPSQLQVAEDRIWFLDGTAHLRVSDGTQAGTVPVPGANVVAMGYLVLPAGIVLTTPMATYATDGVMPAQQIHSAFCGAVGRLGDIAILLDPSGALIATDGKVTGTVVLGTLANTGGYLACTGDGVVCLCDGSAVWRTDGTPAGTSVIAQVPPGMLVSRLVQTRRGLYAVAHTFATGRELWLVDPVLGQFTPAVELAPGEISGISFAWNLGDGDLMLIAGGDETTGNELYVSDGTPVGTTLVADIHAGAASANPALLGIADGNVFFLAEDGVHGRELWAVALAQLGAAHAQAYGHACAGSAGTLACSTVGAATPGSTSFGLALTHALAQTVVAFELGLDDGNAPIGDCALEVAAHIGTLYGVSDAIGRANLSISLPAAPALIGVRFAAQGAAFDAGVARGFSASEGVLVHIGR